MTYVLPRLIIAAIGCCFTCILMWTAWPQVNTTAFCCAGAAWTTALIIYVSYLRKLRRESQELRLAKAELKLASLRLMGQRMRQAAAAPQLASSAHPLDRAA